MQVLSGHEGPVAGLAFSPTSSLLASASWDHTLRTWDVFTGKGQHDTGAWAWLPSECTCAQHTSMHRRSRLTTAIV